MKASPEDFSTHIALGRAWLAKENPARAAAELEVAVKLAPASPDARFSLASAYSRLGRKEDCGARACGIQAAARPGEVVVIEETS